MNTTTNQPSVLDLHKEDLISDLTNNLASVASIIRGMDPETLYQFEYGIEILKENASQDSGVDNDALKLLLGNPHTYLDCSACKEFYKGCRLNQIQKENLERYQQGQPLNEAREESTCKEQWIKYYQKMEERRRSIT